MGSPDCWRRPRKRIHVKLIRSHLSCGSQLLFAGRVDQPSPKTVSQVCSFKHEAITLDREPCASIGGALCWVEDRGIWIRVVVVSDRPRWVVHCWLPCELLAIQRDPNNCCTSNCSSWSCESHGIIGERGWLDLKVPKPDDSTTGCCLSKSRSVQRNSRSTTDWAKSRSY